MSTMTQQSPRVPTLDFADAMIKYIKGRPSVFGDRGEAAVQDHWTHTNEEGGYSGGTCLVNHGLFDSLFRRRAIIPSTWYKFQRQYFSPLADLLSRLRDECESLSVLNWNEDGPTRNSFFVTDDFWTKTTQEKNFRVLTKQLEQRGLLRRHASRYYKDDPDALCIRIGKTWIDIPGSYRNLTLAVDEAQSTGKYSMDFPRIPRLYGERVPVMLLMGTTAPKSLKVKGTAPSPNEMVYRLVEKHSSGAPKRQDILYVLAEKIGERYCPRTVGHMLAYILEVYQGTPAGTTQWEFPYMVPQPDLSVNEERSLDCSQSNWNSHHRGFLEAHPEFASFLEQQQG